MIYRDLVLAIATPALYWPLDATYGIVDQSGSGRNGSEGATGVSIGGFPGSPIVTETTSTDFDNVNDRVTSIYTPFANGTTRTFAGWAYRDTSSGVDTIFGATAAANNALFNLASGSQNVQFSPDAGAHVTVWTAAWPGNAQWVHWALIFDESANNATLYINGALVSTQTQSNAYGASGNFQIGAAGAANFFDGKMAHVAVWEQALTGSEINTLYSEGVTTQRFPRVREKPPLRNYIIVTTPRGDVFRWGEDDPNPERRFSNLSYGDGMPGGFDNFSCTLPRKAGRSWGDLRQYSTIQVRGAGGDIAGEYRLNQLPETAGGDSAISPQATGWQAHLEDDAHAAMVYVDIDLSHWGPASADYKLSLASTYVMIDGALSPDPTSGAPSIWLGGDAYTNANLIFLAASQYDAGALAANIKSVYYAWKKHPSLDASQPQWHWQVLSDSNSLYSSPDATAELRATGPGTGTLTCAASDNRYAIIEFWDDATL